MEAADTAWITAVGGLLAFDVWLVKTERKALTDTAREHRRIAAFGVTVMGLHVADVLGRFDPFRFGGRLILGRHS